MAQAPLPLQLPLSQDPSEPLPVQVIRSRRRRRTLQARIVDGVIEVRVPLGMPAAVEQSEVEALVARLEKRRAKSDIDLVQRAETLSRKYSLRTPTSIEWSARQRALWGSCSTSDGIIRISDRLRGLPTWVLDYVIVHELAHLTHRRHDAAFYALADRYPQAERARGFLLAVDLGVAAAGEGLPEVGGNSEHTLADVD
jgi:predicted metal-dependent hydrolase